MMKIFDCKQVNRATIFQRGNLEDTSAVDAAVAAIIADVRERGDAAVLDYTEKFDGVRLSALAVTEDEIEEAYASCEPFFIESLEKAAENIRAFHSRQVRNSFVITGENGTVLGQRVLPIEKAGLYVPGGTASLASSVLMNAIPAKIAGVSRIVLVTPPGRDGKISAGVLAAAKIAGVTDIYKIGGAQAIAALAYGTESVPKVDKIVGPGNIYVSVAKRMVFGMVDIDMIAGPSEILVLADQTANPVHVAADLLSQAEHDRLASSVLVCDSMELAEKVAEEVERQLKLLPREEIARASIEANGKIIVAADLMEGVEIANEIAPEHLEICVDEPFVYLDAIKNAGSVFLGKNAPEALGDYLAGPNHTLPTLGTARFSSPLSVDEFVKRSSFIYYTKDALAKVRDNIVEIAAHEKLDAHARSVTIRFEE
ncbi:MAG: histidinol dehydrogenase [Ruminococcaceae bacterium]|nr:histidinol dehydrogenase [Oscillospiraceae bacterium]